MARLTDFHRQHTGGRLSSPLADWWRWRGWGDLRRAAATRPRRHARGHADSGEGSGGQRAAMEALLGSREEVRMVGRLWKLAEAQAHGGGAMAGGGLRCSRAGATTVDFYSRYARVVAYSLHGEATDALRRGTASLGMRARRADRRRCGERAHATWRAGSPAETRPGGACGSDAHRAHTQTPSTDRDTVAHGGSAAASVASRARDVAPERALGPVRAMCPCLLAQISKSYM
jgi:hypothetical protein